MDCLTQFSLNIVNFCRVSQLYLTVTETEKNLRVLDVSCIGPGTDNGMNQSHESKFDFLTLI